MIDLCNDGLSEFCTDNKSLYRPGSGHYTHSLGTICITQLYKINGPVINAGVLHL